MAEEAVVPAAIPDEPVSPAALPPGEPAGDTAAAAPAVVSPVAPAPAAEPAIEVPAVSEPTAPAPSLLGAAVAAEETKPETATEAAAAEGPAFTFTLPEGFRAEPEKMAAFTGFLGEAGLNQEQGQRLMDLHVAEVQRIQDAVRQQLAAQQVETFNDMRATWRDEFERDPQLGGNRRQTTINTVVGFLRHFASDGEHLSRLMQIADFTGWGDNPDMIRLFANAAKGLQQQYHEPGPVRAERPAPMAVSRVQRRYTASANGSSR